MIGLSMGEIAQLCDGRLGAGTDADAVVSGEVVQDSRRVGPGDLFVALVGKRADGHDFAGQVLADGAVGVLAGRELTTPSVVVDDPQQALGRLARGVLDRLPDLVVVALTGSSGKTTTKDLLAEVLAGVGPVVAPQGSFNNEIGLPMTALRCRADTAVLVAEMGARGRGHIAYLCGITPPKVGLVLNVGRAHLGEFGSVDGIAEAKGELVEALPPDGHAVLNADDPRVLAMAARTRAGVTTFGESPSADVRAQQIRLDDQSRATFELVHAGEVAEVSLRLHGEHQVSNALAAAAVARCLGLGLPEVAAALSVARSASGWRMEVTERADGVLVVNDAYNANPESMRAALKALATMGRRRRRTWAVLGEMLELGADAAAEHDALGRLAVRLDINRLVAVGEGARGVHLGAAHEGSWGEESTWVPDVEEASALLQRELEAGDVVLVKASRAAGLERVAQALLSEEPTWR